MADWVRTFLSFDPDKATAVDLDIYNADGKVDFGLLLPYLGTDIDPLLDRTVDNVLRQTIRELAWSIAFSGPMMLLTRPSGAMTKFALEAEATKRLFEATLDNRVLDISLSVKGLSGYRTEAEVMVKNALASGFLDRREFALGTWSTDSNPRTDAEPWARMPGVVRMDTAFSPPLGWLEELSKKHQDVVFTARYAGAGWPIPTGFGRWKNGRMTSGTNYGYLHEQDSVLDATWESFRAKTWLIDELFDFT